eukprot:jgi/Botrbrau1/4393/Bobra.105_2s0039.1
MGSCTRGRNPFSYLLCDDGSIVIHAQAAGRASWEPELRQLDRCTLHWCFSDSRTRSPAGCCYSSLLCAWRLRHLNARWPTSWTDQLTRSSQWSETGCKHKCRRGFTTSSKTPMHLITDLTLEGISHMQDRACWQTLRTGILALPFNEVSAWMGRGYLVPPSTFFHLHAEPSRRGNLVYIHM